MGLEGLECKNLESRENGRLFFRDVSFQLSLGQGGLILAELQRDSRRLLQVCASLQKNSGGQISWFGRDMDHLNENSLMNLRRGIGLVHRETRLISNMSILDNITLGLMYHDRVSPRESEGQVAELMSRFGLDHYKDMRPAELSFEKQRLAVYVRELAKKPKLFFLEAPTYDLGQRAYIMVMNEMRELADKKECAFLISAIAPDEGKSWVEWVLYLDKENGNLFWPADQFDPTQYRHLQTSLGDSTSGNLGVHT